MDYLTKRFHKNSEKVCRLSKMRETSSCCKCNWLISQVWKGGTLHEILNDFSKLKFGDNKVCDACFKGKYTKFSFKTKKQVSSTRVLELVNMDLCGHVKAQSRVGKKYILVIVDDYSRFTWTMLLKSKYETAEVMMTFIKIIQIMVSCKIAGLGPIMELSSRMQSLTPFVLTTIFIVASQLLGHHNKMEYLKRRTKP